MSIEPEQQGGSTDSCYDDGLAHCHNWAREQTLGYRPLLVVADAGSVGTPSSVLHDDGHYAMA